MSVPATEAVTPGLQSLISASTAAGKTGQNDDKQMFMELMVAQLRYQDPLNPADTGEFLSQTAQFNALEQMQNVAEQTSLVLSATLAFGAAGLVGREITYTGPDGSAVTGVVDGVTFAADGPTLQVGDVDVPLGAVRTVAGEAGAGAAPAPVPTDAAAPGDPAADTDPDGPSAA